MPHYSRCSECERDNWSDLTNIGQFALQAMQSSSYTGKATTVEEYLKEALLEPDAYISTHCENGPCSAGVMTASLAQSFTSEELAAVIAYFQQPPTAGNSTPLDTTPLAQVVTNLSEEEFLWAMCRLSRHTPQGRYRPGPHPRSHYRNGNNCLPSSSMVHREACQTG